MFDRRLVQNFDWVLLLLLLLIAAMSVFNLYSATHPIREMGGDHVFIKQIYWFLIGFGVFFVMATINYSILEQFAYPIFFVSVALLLLVLFSGKISSGSQRWLNLGPIAFQPSELTKIAVVLVLAKFYSEEDSLRALTLRDSWLPFMLIGLPSALILKEPDLGTALLLIAVSFSLLLFVRINWKSLMILGVAAVSMAPFIWFRLKEYQQDRILTFIRPDMDPLGTGYHINQSKIAIGSGLFWGKGYLQGTQTRLLFLPERHTDFAFSVLAEEWGFVFSVFLLLLYLCLILCGLNIARTSKDKFGALIAVGFVAIIFWHVVINVGMVTGLLPVVGIPLVLFSYGGSSLIATMGAMGILMSISMRRFMFSA